MITLFSAIAISVVCGILPSVWPNVYQSWEVYAICTRIEVLTWLFVLFLFIPYKRLSVKTTALCLCCIEVVDIAAMGAYWGSTSSPYLSYLFKTLICLLVLLRYVWRNYDMGSDALDEDHFFAVSIIPDNFQDFVLSLIKEPVGGIGIYADGGFYHYKKGRLVVHDKRYLTRLNYKYRIRRGRKLDRKRLTILIALRTFKKYSAWSWLWNCKTVLEPILSEKGKPLFWNGHNNGK